MSGPRLVAGDVRRAAGSDEGDIRPEDEEGRCRGCLREKDPGVSALRDPQEAEPVGEAAGEEVEGRHEFLQAGGRQLQPAAAESALRGAVRLYCSGSADPLLARFFI